MDERVEAPQGSVSLSLSCRKSGAELELGPVPCGSFPFSKLCVYLLGCARSWLWHVGSSSLTRDQTLGPLHSKRGVLAPGPPGEWILTLFLAQ